MEFSGLPCKVEIAKGGIHMKKKIAILWGILGALGVFAFGFTMMYLLWKMIGSSNGLPGLFYYRAATFGDALCLPVLTGSMVAFNQYNIKWRLQGRHKKISCIVALVASAIAVLIQASWLIRDDTALNWSIPLQHYFNLAGWYHSLFFIVMFGVIAYQISNMWFVMRNKQEEYAWSERVQIMLFSFSGSLFLFMFVTDDYGSYLPLENLICIVAVGILVLEGIFILTATLKFDRMLIASVLTGVISSYCLTLFICIPVNGDIVLAVGAGICACFLWRVNNSLLIQLIFQDIWTIPFYMSAVYVISGLESVKEQIFVLIPLIIFTILNEYSHNKELKSRFWSIAAVGVYPAVAYLLEMSAFGMEIKKFLFGLVVSILFRKEIKDYFCDLMKDERKKNKNIINEVELTRTKQKVYLQMILGIVAAILLLSHWLLDLARINQSRIETGNVYLPLWSVGTLLILTTILGTMGLKKLRRNIVIKKIALLISVVLEVIALYLIWINVGNYLRITWTPIKNIMFFCSLFACCGAAMLLADGYYRNMVLLRGEVKNQLIGLTAVLQLVGSILFNLSVVILLLCHQTWESLALILGLEIIIFIVIPVFLGQIQRYNSLKYHVVGNNPISGIAQDGLMITMLLFFGTGLPCMYIYMVNMKSWGEWFAAMSLIYAAFAPIGFCLKNNVKHIAQQREVLKEFPNEEEMWNVLHISLVKQSKQTVFAMFPYVCVAISGCILKRHANNMNYKKAAIDVYETYIDKRDYTKEEPEDDYKLN